MNYWFKRLGKNTRETVPIAWIARSSSRTFASFAVDSTRYRSAGGGEGDAAGHGEDATEQRTAGRTVALEAVCDRHREQRRGGCDRQDEAAGGRGRAPIDNNRPRGRARRGIA